MNEIWATVPETEGRYEVSSEGRVRSTKFQRILVSQSSAGQKTVCIVFKGNAVVFEIRHLIAYAFLGSDILSLAKPQLIHKDKNVHNIRLSNLMLSNTSDISGEVWSPVVGFENYYEVSSLGRIKRLQRLNTYIRKDTGTVCYRAFAEKIMSPTLSADGYMQLEFRADGTNKYVNVHRVVAEAFIPNPNNLPQVNHKDGNRSNNVVSNLEWVTARENVVDQISRSGRNACINKIREVQGRPVKCIETGQVFPSLGVPARLLNTDSSAIVGAIQRGTCIKGWTFAFLDQLESLNISEKEYCVQARRKYFQWPRARTMEVEGWTNTYFRGH